jgi:hypothetical protein
MAGSGPVDGPGLGDNCYDSTVSEEVLRCGEGYCSGTLSCLGETPNECTRSCTCNTEGLICFPDANPGGTDAVCCEGLECIRNGLLSGPEAEVFTCELPGTLPCQVDCEITIDPDGCGSDPEANVVWLCRDEPEIVFAECEDMATSLPRWCCPPTILPECLPE